MPGSAAPVATVVITACSIERGLLDTLVQVRAQADDVGAEVLLVFNTSPEVLGSAACRLAGEHVDQLVFEPRPGKSAALNAAVDAAKAEVVAFTDDDATPEPGWLSRLVQPLLHDPAIAGVGGPVEPVLPESGAPGWYTRLTGSKPTSHLGPKHRLETDQYELPTGGSISPVPLGANCAWRKPWLLRFPYRENLGPNRVSGLRGGEDTCFAIEVLEAGGPVVYAREALVRHPVAPNRLTRDYVLEGARIQGREYARIMDALGRPIPNPVRLRRNARKRANRGPMAWVQSPYRTFKRELRREFCQGVCEDLGWSWHGVTRAEARREALRVQAR